jgi:predicted phosphodiesterase
MRLAVISDSHLSIPDDHFERVYDRHLAGADALLHCGDMVSAPSPSLPPPRHRRAAPTTSLDHTCRTR